MAHVSYLQAEGIHVSSAGTRAVVGHAIHDYAARYLANAGANPSEFAARQLTARIAANADLVLTMTVAQRDAVLQLAPTQLRRTFTLVEAAALMATFDVGTTTDLQAFRPQLPRSEIRDIPDPMGQSAEVFDAVGNQIAVLIPEIVALCRRS